VEERGKAVNLKESEADQKHARLLAGEGRLAGLVKAFEAYFGWQNGDGDVTENRARFGALVKAWEAYKGGG
jgi:hypothetical protein